MRSTLLLPLATFAFASLGLAAPVRVASTTLQKERPHRIIPRPALLFDLGLDADEDEDVVLARFDNGEFHHSPTGSPAGALEQARPLPTLYLMSLEHSSTRAGKPQHTSVPEGWHESQHPRIEGIPAEEKARAAGHDNPDVVIIAVFGTFIFLVTVFEIRQRRVISVDQARCKLRSMAGMRGRVRLDGHERQLRARQCEATAGTNGDRGMMMMDSR